MYYQKGDVQFLFINIPRTGSRHVHEIVVANDVKVVFHSIEEYTKLFGSSRITSKRSFQHYSLDDFRKICTVPKNVFSVVRNPVTRFKSGFLQENYRPFVENISKFEDYDVFVDLLENKKIHSVLTTFYNKQNRNDVWKYNREIYQTGLKDCFERTFDNQSCFIDSSVKLWKFENKFEKQFCDWINDNFNLDFDINKTVGNYVKGLGDRKIDIELSKAMIRNIERYYCDDMNLWESIN